MYVRQIGNKLILPRYNKQIVESLDSKYIRISDYQWIIPKSKPISELKIDLSRGCYVFGKGESLDKISKLEDLPIFCINESVQIAEKFNNEIICVDLDRNKYTAPEKYKKIVSIHSEYKYKDGYCVPNTHFSSSLEVLFDYLSNVSPIILVGFDYLENGSDKLSKSLIIKTKRSHYQEQLKLKKHASFANTIFYRPQQ